MMILIVVSTKKGKRTEHDNFVNFVVDIVTESETIIV